MAWATTEFTMVGGNGAFGDAVIIEGAGNSNIQMLQYKISGAAGEDIKIEVSCDGTNFEALPIIDVTGDDTDTKIHLMTQAYPYYRFSAQDVSSTAFIYTCILAEMV